MAEKIFRWTLLFLFGGFSYIGLELLWRSRSHWTMFLAGGLCFVLLIALNAAFSPHVPWWERCFAGSFVITSVELVTGVIVNLWLGWQVWDYSSYQFHFLGQISLLYSTLWFFLSAPVFWIGSYLHQVLSHFSFSNRLGAMLHRKYPKTLK